MKNALFALMIGSFCLTGFCHANDGAEALKCNGEIDDEGNESVDFRDDEEIDYDILQAGKADLAVGSKGIANSFFIGMSPSFAKLPIQKQRNLISEVTQENYNGVKYYIYKEGSLIDYNND